MTATPLAHSVEAAADLAGVGRTTIYLAIRDGSLTARKVGRRTILLESDLRAWLAKLPRARTSDQQDPRSEAANSPATKHDAVGRKIRNNFESEGGDND